MNREELMLLMKGNESPSVEFKPAILSRKELAEYAVGIGNAGGGYLVMGTSDKRPRRILPVDRLSEAEIQRMRESVADAAQIHISLEYFEMPEGAVFVARIPARPRGIPFHTRDGKYLIRLGEDLRGLTLPELDAIRQEAGVEFTAQPVPGDWQGLVRPAGMEGLRALMQEAHAPADLAKLPDADLLRALGVLDDAIGLSMAGLLLVGVSDAIRASASHAQWQFFRMLSDTDYDQADGGHDCITVALRRLRDLINASNPIVTFKGDLVHPEFPRYPHVAVRELLVNAFVHRDYHAHGTVFVKLYPNRLEISNPGGFLGGITPENILHHASEARYDTLFGAVTRMRLANAANLGVPRIFRECLCEGKEPPGYWTSGQSVRVTVRGQDARREFFELAKNHPELDVDELLVLHYLTRHREISARHAADLCARSLSDASEFLSRLVAKYRLLEAGGTGKGRYYRLSRSVYEKLGTLAEYEVDKRLSREHVKARVLAVLAERSLSNAQVREITQMSRKQVFDLMRSIGSSVELTGKGRGSRWVLRKKGGGESITGKETTP